MKEMSILILAIMKEVAALKTPETPGRNHVVYNKICKGLSPELFQPVWGLPHPDMSECFNLNLKHFPLKNITVKAATAKASIRKRAIKEEISIERQVWAYISSTRWAPAPAYHQGATWLELYVRFTQVGGETQTKWERHQANDKDQNKQVKP